MKKKKKERDTLDGAEKRDWGVEEASIKKKKKERTKPKWL